MSSLFSPPVKSFPGLKAALCGLALSLTGAAAAEPVSQRQFGLEHADLRVYLDCARSSNERLLGFGEAEICSRVFLRIKLSFVLGMTAEAFDHLPLRTKAEVNTLGYLRYRSWLEENSALVERLTAEPLSVAATN